jgi:hypothetical protein
MIDNFSIGLTHSLMMIAAIILLFRRDLDKEAPPKSTTATEEKETERRIRSRASEEHPAQSPRVVRSWGEPPDA